MYVFGMREPPVLEVAITNLCWRMLCPTVRIGDSDHNYPRLLLK